MSILHFLVLQLAMQRFTQKIVQMMKDENLFESQGGPIILAQVLFLEINSRILHYNIWHISLSAQLFVPSLTYYQILALHYVHFIHVFIYLCINFPCAD
jgi:hypothetical protein